MSDISYASEVEHDTEERDTSSTDNIYQGGEVHEFIITDEKFY